MTEIPQAPDVPPLVPPAPSPAPDISDDLRFKQIDILMAELQQRFTEMRDYNGRYQQAMLLYLSAVGAGIGLTASGKLSIAAVRDYQDAPVIVILFIMLNLLVVFHGITLSSWSMSYAKFNSVFLAPRIAELAKMQDIAVMFDRWGGDIKGVALRARGIGYMLWVSLVGMTSLGSLSVVNFRKYAAGGMVPRALLIAAAVGLPTLLVLTAHTAFSEWFITPHFANPNPPDVRRKVWTAALIASALVLLTAAAIVAGHW